MPSASIEVPNACRECGVVLDDPDRMWCPACYPVARVERDRAGMAAALRAKGRLTDEGRDPAQSEAAKANRRATRTEQRRLELAWEAAHPGGASEAEYRELILPGLASIRIVALAELGGVPDGHAAQVKQEKRVPHPRH